MNSPVNCHIIRVFLFFLCIYSKNCFSQTLFSNIKYQLETGTYLSTSGQIPFWLRSNQYGIVPLESQLLTFRGAVHKEYDSTKNEHQKLKKFGIGYGVWGVANVSKQSGFLLPEAYLKARYGAFEFYGGRRREIIGLVDTMLTSGSYIWSGNALPIPKIQISIPNYFPIIGKGLISIKGGYAHGWFNNNSVKNFYLHQKWLYGRIGKPNWKIKFYGGFNHQVQWGGYPLKPYIEQKTGKLITNYGNDFKTYLDVVSGISLNANGDGLDLDGVPLNEAWNRSGNHLGTIDIGTEFIGKRIDLFIYRQSIYDDGSLFYLNNIADGLLGISIKRKNSQKGLLKICFEYINTTNQGGITGGDNTIPQLRGQDNYFNNFIYKNGWTYNNNVLGTPLITTLGQLNNSLTNKYSLSDISDNAIINNKVSGYNISLSGKILKTDFTTKLMWSKNLGFYRIPLNAKQFSLLQQISYQLPKYLLLASVSVDNGELFSNNAGCYLGIRRTFF